MKKLSTCIVLMEIIAVFIIPTIINAQLFMNEPVQGGAAMKQNVTQESIYLDRYDYRILTRSHTYHLTKLDNRFTSKAIAWEQIKELLANELANLIIQESKAERGESAKISTKPKGVFPETLPSPKEIKALLPSVVSIKQTGEDWREGTLAIEAKLDSSPVQIASMVSLIHENRKIFAEIIAVRTLSHEAMNDILQRQKDAASSDKGTASYQRYLESVHRLLAVDSYEKASYFRFTGQFQLSIDAYSKAIEILPEFAAAYRNRGRLYLSYLKDRPTAISDFNSALRAYNRNARKHMKSGEFEHCIEDTGAALTLNAEYPDAYYQRAACRVGLGQQDKAREDLVTAAKLGHGTAQELLTARGIDW